MDEKQLQLLLELIRDGGDRSIEDVETLESIIENEGIGVLYPVMPEGAVESAEELQSLFPDLKKKDSADLSGQTESMASRTGMENFDVSLDADVTDPKGLRYGSGLDVGEKDTLLERTFGKNFVTDFFGDMYRAGVQGLGQGATVDDAIGAYIQGSSMSEEAIQDYINAVKASERSGMSDEMKSFNNIYQDNGGGILGFVKGVGANPSVLPQLLISSFASMANPTVAAGAGVGAGLGAATGAGIGAAAGAVGTPVGSAIAGTVGAGTGATFGAFAGAGATLETGLAFTEFLKEEIEKKGLQFDNEGIRAVLDDEEALQSIRNRSAGRGFTIGIIDGLSRGLAGKLAGAPIKAAQQAGKVVSKGQKARAGLGALGIEAIGGGTGEAAGRAVAGQEMDVAEIGFEAITGVQSGVFTVPEAVTGRTITDLLGVNNAGVNVFAPPVYGIKNKKGVVQKMSKDELLKFVNTAKPQDIRTMQFEVKNDAELQKIIDNKKQAAQIELDLPDFVQGENRTEMVKLEQELRNMQDPDLKANQIRIKQINEKLDALVEKAQRESVDAKPKVSTFTEEQAINELQSEGVENPTPEQIKEKLNALQESSTAQVDVQESARDSQEVGEGDTPGVVTQESETQNQGEVKPIETQTQEEININVAPFFETSIESTTEASGLRKSPQYNEYKQRLRNIAEDIGVDLEIEEGVGGYVNEAGTKVREVSNVVKLKNATLEQGAEYASLVAALAPEVQESSIAAEYVADDTPGVTGQEYTLEVSDPEGTFQALREVGIDEYTLNESKNLLTLFKFNDDTEVDVLNKLKKLKENLDGRNIQYTAKARESIKSEYITVEERKSFLTTLRRNLINEGKEGTSLYKKVISAINRDAENQGITPNEYIKLPTEPTTPEVTADADRVQTIIDDIVKKTEQREQTRDDGGTTKKKRRATKKQTLLDNTINYLQNSKLYQQLDDTSRERLVNELNTRFGFKIKKAAIPSFVKPKDKKIVVNERVALKDQIKLEAKAAKESAKAYKKAMQNIAAEVKGLRRGRKISTAQSSAITSRLANVNLNSKKSVDNYLKYVDRVFTKAETIETLRRAKVNAKRAKKQVGGRKTGGIPNASKVILENLFSINPFAIPDEKVDAYLDLVKQFGTTKTQVQLTRNIKENVAIAEDILNAVYQDAEATIEAAPAEVEAKDYNLTQAVKEIKQDVIRDSEINQLQDEAQKQDARDIQKLTSEDIKSLVTEKKDGTKDYSMVEKLRTGKQQIQNGVLVKDVTDILTEVDKNRRAKILDNLKKKNGEKVLTQPNEKNIIDRMVNYGSSIKAALSSSTNFLVDKLEGQSTFFMDDVLGNFNSKAIYDNTIGAIGRAYSKYNTETNLAYKSIDQADAVLEGDVSKVRRKLGITKSTNSVIESKYKVRLYQLQREHEANIVDGKPNPKAPPAMEFADKTVNSRQVLDPYSKTILRNLMDKYGKDGVIDAQAIEKSFTPAEKKYLKLIDQVNQSLANKAVYISGSLHGNKINLLNDYTHHAVLDTDGKQSDLLRKEERFTALPSTKSGTIVERTAGAKAISFDPSYSARRGVQETNLDYYMTREVRTVRKTVNQLKKNAEAANNQTAVDVADAIEDVVNNRLTTVFQKSFYDMTILDKIGGPIAKIGYYQSLASAPRMLVEMASNLLMMVKNPKLATQAFKEYSGITLTDPNRVEIGTNFLNRAKSSVTQKLYNIDELGGKMADLNEFIRPDQSNSQARSEVANKALQILKYLPFKQTFKGVDKMSARLLSYGDQAISRPLWFGTFNSAFKKAVKKYNKESISNLTPEEIKLFSEGKSKFNSPKYKQAVEAATKAADRNAITVASSTNPFDGIGKNMIRPSDGLLRRAYKQANRFMIRFQLFEFGSARHAINALYKSGDISKSEAVGLLTGVTMRMTMYMVGYTALTQLFDEELFGAEEKEEDKEKDFASLLARQFIGSTLSLGLRRQLGNIPALPVNFMIEHGLNEPFLGSLRNDEEYDPYKHSLIFNQLGKMDLQKDFGLNLDTLIRIFGGPYGPLAKSILRTGRVGSRAVFNKTEKGRQKNIDELTNRMTVEVLGNLGLLPFYKDIRRIILKQMYGKSSVPYKPPKQPESEFLKDLDFDNEYDMDGIYDEDTEIEDMDFMDIEFD